MYFCFSKTFRPLLGSMQPRIEWVPGALSLGVKRPECEADHSPQSSAQVKDKRRYTSSPSRRLYACAWTTSAFLPLHPLPYRKPDESTPRPSVLFLRIILILYFNLHLGLPNMFFIQVSVLQTYVPLLSPYLPHALSISFVLI